METLAKEAKKVKFLKITLDQVNELLTNCQLLIEHDTMVSDKIRLFLCGETYLVQEKSDKDEFLVRAFDTELQARQFIMDRMKIYEDMWDGCGCKVYYYD